MSRETLDSFVGEVRDTLPRLRRALAMLHAWPDDETAREEAHRLVHSIKGTAALIGLDDIAQIAGRQEELLECVIANRLAMDDRLRDTLERLSDLVESATNGLQTGTPCDERLPIEAQRLFDRHSADSGSRELVSRDEVPSESSSTTSALTDDGQTNLGKTSACELPGETTMFRADAIEHLHELAELLDTYRRDLTRWDVLADVRRRLHSLKDSARVSEFADFAELAHHAEDLLQRLLDRSIPPTENAADCLQACVDGLEQRLDGPFDETILRQIHDRLDHMVGSSHLNTKQETFDEIADAGTDCKMQNAKCKLQIEDVTAGLTTNIEFDDRSQLSDEMLEVFTEEAEDHLGRIDAAFAGLQQNPAHLSLIQEVRRSAHTIKGAAGTVGLRLVSKVAHRMEDLLDHLFEQQQSVALETLTLLDRTTDTLQTLVHGEFDQTAMTATLTDLYQSYDAALQPSPNSEAERQVSFNSEGVESNRPGLAAQQTTLGDDDHDDPSPLKGLCQSETETPDGGNPLGYGDALNPNSQGSELRSQPWAMCQNSFGVDAALCESAAEADATPIPHIEPTQPGHDAQANQVLGEPVVSATGLCRSDAEPDGSGSPAGLLTADTPSEIAPLETTPNDSMVAPASTNELIVTDALPMFAAWNRLPQPNADHNSESTKPTKHRETLRVPLDRVDSLVREVGELIINRSAFEQRMSDFTRCVDEIRRSVERLRHTSQELAAKYGVEALGGRRRLWGEGASLGASDEFDALEFDRYSDFHLLSRSLTETTTDLGTVGNELRNLAGDFDQLLTRQGRLSRDTQDRLMRIRMVPLAVLTTRLHRTVRVVAGQRGKSVDFLMQGGDTELDKRVLDELADPLLHLLRNAVDHGVELPDERLKRGKPERATIRVQAYYQGTQVVVCVGDDGAGLNLDSIRETAVRNGLATADEIKQLRDDELAAFIFRPGFSTADEISEISGRGVGMDIVREAVQKLKGTIHIDSQPGRGVTFTIRLPMTMAVTRALLLQTSRETFALPLASVVQILRLDRKVVEHLGTAPMIRLGGEVLPLIYLANRLNLRQPADKSTVTMPVLVVASGERRIAVAVDRILAGRDIVVKTLGSHLKHVRGLIGATLLGDGSVVPILDAAELVGHNVGHVSNVPANTPTIEWHFASVPHEMPAEPPLIMVVDDSVSVRRVMSNSLKKAGWTVLEAKDGLDALDKLHKADRRPDLFLLDIEMPRMDGYELLSSLRAHSDHRDTPIVMVTSRAGDKHRHKAERLGATDYIVKPYQEDSLLSLIRQLLTRQREAIPV